MGFSTSQFINLCVLAAYLYRCEDMFGRFTSGLVAAVAWDLEMVASI